MKRPNLASEKLGYHFFTNRGALSNYVEELLNIDLDVDGHAGEPDGGGSSE